MHKLILSVLLLASLASCQYWRQVWSDEFDGTALDTSKWQFEVNCDGGGNAELQCYTAREQNAKVANGRLTITARPENYNGKGYTSARLNTARSASWLYGKFEIRTKLPRGKHLWPAFWMLPTDYKYGTWAASGEIDIMEYRGQATSKVEGTLHFGGQWPNNMYQGSGPKDMGMDLSADFHVFSVEWERDQIRWYVDGQMYHSMTLVRSFYSNRGTNPYNAQRQPFDQRFHLLINLAIGGGFFPADQYGTLTPQDAANWADATYQIDYIRVYEATTVPPVVSAPPAVSSNRATTRAITSRAVTSRATVTPTETPEETTASSDVIGSPDGLNNAENQDENGKAAGKIWGVQKSVVGGVAAIIGVLIIILIVVAVVFIRRRRSAKTDVMSSTELAVAGLTPQSSSQHLPQVQMFVPAVGGKCMAKYSDGEFYPATIEEIKGMECLVNYGPSYGNEQAWVNVSNMKA